MRFDSLAILILSAGCLTPFAIAGLLRLIDHCIERGMRMYVNIRCGCGDCIHFDSCNDSEIVFHDDPVCSEFVSKFETKGGEENDNDN